jgi:hypothetical protein
MKMETILGHVGDDANHADAISAYGTNSTSAV